MNKDDYDLSEVPDSMVNYTLYFDNDKKFEDKVQKFIDAVTVGDLELDSKSYNILKTINRTRKCSDRQKKYLDDIEERYEQAIFEKHVID